MLGSIQKKGFFALGVCLLAVMVWSAMAGAVTLRVTLANTDPKVSAGTEQLLAEFTRKTGIQVENVNTYGTDFERLAVEYIAGVAADVILTWNQVPEMAIRNGFFLDLQPYIARDGRQKLLADFIPGTVQAVSKNGAIYGFPFYSSAGAMYTNAAMFDNAGLATPNRNWNWDEFAKIASRLTRRKADGSIEIYGVHSTMGWLNVLPWLWQAGAQPHPADDPSRVTLDTPQAALAFEFLQDLVQRQFMTWDFRVFHNKGAAMSPSGSWEFQFLDGSFPISITSLPVGPAGRANFTNTDIMAINAKTKHPDEAWTFLDWFYSTDVQKRYLLLRGNQPARMSLGYQWIESVRQANPGKDIRGLEVFIEDAVIAKPQPFFTNASVINQHIMPAVQDIILKGAPARPTLEQMSRIATNFLRTTR